MKTIKMLAAILSIVCFSQKIDAQKIKTIDGDPSILKNEKSINIEFTYNNMSVGKFEIEKDYIDKKKAEYNDKEAGRGDTWAKSWITDRKMVFEPKFLQLFERETEMTVTPTAKYTLIFHTIKTEPGFNIVITKKNAQIDAEATIVETANRSKIIAVISIKNAPGRTFTGNDFATGDRIAECYAVSGKKLGKFIK